MQQQASKLANGFVKWVKLYTAWAFKQLQNKKCANLLAHIGTKHELKESLFARGPIRKFVCNGPIYQLLKSLSIDINILSPEVRPRNPPKRAKIL